MKPREVPQEISRKGLSAALGSHSQCLLQARPRCSWPSAAVCADVRSSPGCERCSRQPRTARGRGGGWGVSSGGIVSRHGGRDSRLAGCPRDGSPPRPHIVCLQSQDKEPDGVNLSSQTPAPWISRAPPRGSGGSTGDRDSSPNTMGSALPTSRQPHGHVLQDHRHKVRDLSRCSLV